MVARSTTGGAYRPASTTRYTNAKNAVRSTWNKLIAQIVKDRNTAARIADLERKRDDLTPNANVTDFALEKGRKMQYDMSKVTGLTHNKTAHIIARDGFAMTGFVLTHEDGRKCIVDMSAVRWFHDKKTWADVMFPEGGK